MNRDLILKYIWVIGIIGGIIAAASMGFRMKKATSQERLKMIIGASFWLSITWIVMGIGSIIGNVPTIIHFLRPRDGNPYVLVWWASVLLLYIIGAYWIFVGKGALKLANSGVMQLNTPNGPKPISEKNVKLIFLLNLFGVIIFTLVMWLVNIPLPPNVK
jgi:hypothetical protein